MVYTTYLWGFGGWFIIVLLCFININLLIIASSHGMICASPLVCWIRTEFSTMKRRNDISYLKGPREKPGERSGCIPSGCAAWSLIIPNFVDSQCIYIFIHTHLYIYIYFTHTHIYIYYTYIYALYIYIYTYIYYTFICRIYIYVCVFKIQMSIAIVEISCLFKDCLGYQTPFLYGEKGKEVWSKTQGVLGALVALPVSLAAATGLFADS